ncbi:MAG: 5-formyltetrahydrofolate cyclo-ligase [Chthoniobacterales bacterium]
MPPKTELRRSIRAQLARMSPAAVAAASESIRQSIPSLPRWQDARVVAAYAALPGEPDLRPLDWIGEKTVLLPRVDGEELVFHAVSDANQLKLGAVGVMEPDPEKCAAFDPREAEIIFVPGLAFTAEGQRLGRGRGFYDRLLAALPPEILRVGVCFAEQIVTDIPSESHDKEVDVVLSQPAGTRTRLGPRRERTTERDRAPRQ